MTKDRAIEIMAPVGNPEALTAAWQGGANSVYFGIGSLNMRAGSSRNFNFDDLKAIVEFAEEKNIRTYLTLNTIIYDENLEEMQQTIDAASGAGVTAIIASDMAVVNYCRTKGMEVHMSTQANISNIEAVKYWSQWADTIVTARELSLDQVKDITTRIKEDRILGPSGKPVQIEVFAHGALCMAISGKCSLSLDNENSSANRGKCLQLCRRPYKAVSLDGNHEFVIDQGYIMSPKDLCTIEFLDKILDSGISVLKIEGRGRPADYVKTVVSCYREAANYWLNGEWNKAPVENWMKKLKSVYNRGFWEGFYLGRSTAEWTKTYGNMATEKKVYVGKISNFFATPMVAEIKVEAEDLNVGDKFSIIGPTTGVYEAIVEELRVDELPTSVATKGSVCSVKISELVRRGDKLYKIVPSELIADGQ